MRGQKVRQLFLDRCLAEQLPATDGFESVYVMFDRRPAAVCGPRDRDHIETRRGFQQAVPLQKGERQPSQPALLLLVDGIGGVPRFVRATRFDFDEDDRRTIHGDQIDFAQTLSIGAGHDHVAFLSQESGRFGFSTLAQCFRTSPTGDQVTDPRPDSQGNRPPVGK